MRQIPEGEASIITACVAINIIATICLPVLFVGVDKPDHVEQVPLTVVTLLGDTELPAPIIWAQWFSERAWLRYTMAGMLGVIVALAAIRYQRRVRLWCYGGVLWACIIMMFFEFVALFAVVYFAS